MQAVILCGGFGTRLKDVVSDVPKPMAPIKEIPFLSYLVQNLAEKGFKSVVFLTGYKSECIEAYFTKDSFGLKVAFVKEEVPLGTGGALLNAWDKLESEFVLLNGDTFFDVDFSLLFNFARQQETGSCISLRACEDCSRYGLVNIDENFRVHSFIEKGSVSADTEGLINGGIYYFKKSVLEKFYSQWKQDFLLIETQVFPRLVEEKVLYALPLGGMFIDIGIPEDYKVAQALIPSWAKQSEKPAAILVSASPACGFNISDYKTRGFYTFLFLLNSSDTVDLAAFDEVVNLQKELYSELDKVLVRKILKMAEKYKINLRKSVILLNNANINSVSLPYIETSDVTGAR